MNACCRPFLGALLLLCVLVDGIFAISIDRDLCGNVTVSAIDCTDPLSSIFNPGNHGPCSLEGFSGTSVTLWQLFTLSLPLESGCNETNSSGSCVPGLSLEWHRVSELRGPSQSLTCTSVEENEYQCEVSMNATLTLNNIQTSPDTDPNYTVSLTLKDCPEFSPEKYGRFSLEVSGPMCTIDLPAPTQTRLSYTFSQSLQCPRMNATFTGGIQDDVFTFLWKDSENKTVCFTAGFTQRMGGRYTCGWTTNDPRTCNSTIWLSIGNCSSSDAGNYSIFGTRGDSNGSAAHILLSFHSTEDEERLRRETIIIACSTSVGFLLLLALFGATVVAIAMVYRHRPKTITTTSTTIKVQTCEGDGEAVIEVTESVTVSQSERDVQAPPGPPSVWRSMRSPRQKLSRTDLVTVSQKIVHWQGLARHLGLEEPDIVAIQADFSHDYNEQKVQSLLKWFREHRSPPTRQSLVKIIEEKLQDPQLARDVERALVDTQRDRAQSAQ